ncbi:MAG: DoxX family protein [Opitutales bacterium]|nr:DoxX family protein [Opitutales bacterium]
MIKFIESPVSLLSTDRENNFSHFYQDLGITDLANLFSSMPTILEILSILVFGSIIFVWGVRYNNIKDEFKHFNLPKWLRDLVGILKFSFAIMLLNGDYEIVRLGALGIAILMIAALFTHIRLKSSAPKMLPSFSLLCACLAISYMCTQLLLAV